ncbi:hypothetical protein V1512DRAFT_225130 [Lipomyces arxii]|uniref:uncharacterized protein n=1 Tax=Lipomyces arxii TaxID=56418 RepID=UPI0034CD5439
MSDARYSYDENGEVWPYFAVTLVSLVLFPSTWKATMKVARNETQKVHPEKNYKPENYDYVEKFRKKNSKSKIFTKTNFVLALGWGVLLFLAYYIHTQESPEDVKRFDPYEILGVSYSATEKEIKSKYRKLSLRFHPDKIRNIVNTTREAMESQFVEMTKAYKSLTDEETRRNYIEYGHPDGPQPMKHGIALPKFLVGETGSPLVILGYGCLIGIVLPIIVWRWWSGTKEYTKSGIHNLTTANVFETFSKTDISSITHDDLIQLLAESEEFRIILPGIEVDAVKGYLTAYLERKQVDDELRKLTIVARVIDILEGMLDIASAFKNIDLFLKIISLTQAFSQALPPNSHPLLQLPKVDKNQVLKQKNMSVSALLALSDEGQKKALGITDDKDLKIAQEVAKQIPSIEVLTAFFKVPGEDAVTPQSIAHLVIKFKLSYPGQETLKFEPAELEEKDTPLTIKKPLATNDVAPLLDQIDAPYLPVYIRPKWHVLLVNPRENRIIEAPAAVSRMYSDGNVSTFKIQLSAPIPDQLGKYRFLVELKSNAYVGADASTTAVLEIQPTPQVEVVEDDISDPEEDSIAGTMAQLRGGKTKKRVDKYDDDDESESNSGSESEAGTSEEDEESGSDINTDTEDES